MDLRTRDVADLLDVSVATVRRWLKRQGMPAYRLNKQYFFDKGEVETWLMRSRFIHSKRERKDLPRRREGSSSNLYRAMHRGGVIRDIDGEDKWDIIREVALLIAPRLGLDSEMVTELLFNREKLMTTAVNKGFAFPHPREQLLKQPGSDQVVTVFLKRPMPFGALDGEPVHTLFFIFSSSSKIHLHILSKLAYLIGQKKALDFLLLQPTLENLLSHVKEMELGL